MNMIGESGRLIEGFRRGSDERNGAAMVPDQDGPGPHHDIVAQRDTGPRHRADAEVAAAADRDVASEVHPRPKARIRADAPFVRDGGAVIDEDMLRTQLPPPVVDLNTQLPPAEAPKISIDTSTLRSKPAPKEPPVIKLDLGDIRNQRTVRFSGDAPKPSDEEKAED